MSIPDADARFARPRNPERETTELSVGGIPKVLIDLLDAEVRARGLANRQPIVKEILTEWGRVQARRITFAQRIISSNSAIEDLAGLGADSGMADLDDTRGQ